jgi:hypothetical protein
MNLSIKRSRGQSSTICLRCVKTECSCSWKIHILEGMQNQTALENETCLRASSKHILSEVQKVFSLETHEKMI